MCSSDLARARTLYVRGGAPGAIRAFHRAISGASRERSGSGTSLHCRRARSRSRTGVMGSPRCMSSASSFCNIPLSRSLPHRFAVAGPRADGRRTRGPRSRVCESAAADFRTFRRTLAPNRSSSGAIDGIAVGQQSTGQRKAPPGLERAQPERRAGPGGVAKHASSSSSQHKDGL